MNYHHRDIVSLERPRPVRFPSRIFFLGGLRTSSRVEVSGLKPRHSQTKVLLGQDGHRCPEVANVAWEGEDVVGQSGDGGDQVRRVGADGERSDEREVACRNARTGSRESGEVCETNQSTELGGVDGREELEGTEGGDRVLDDGELEQEVGDDAVQHAEDAVGDAAEALSAGNGNVLGDGTDQVGKVRGDT